MCVCVCVCVCVKEREREREVCGREIRREGERENNRGYVLIGPHFCHYPVTEAVSSSFH